MYRIHWDRVLIFVALVSLPLVLHWLSTNVSIGGFADVPVLGQACQEPEVKGLLLLGIILVGVYLFIRTLLRG